MVRIATDHSRISTKSKSTRDAFQEIEVQNRRHWETWIKHIDDPIKAKNHYNGLILTVMAQGLSTCNRYFSQNLKYLMPLTAINHTAIFHTECICA